MLQILARLQGWYFSLTGLWALIDLDSFQAVTGPKVDLWLVKTVGVLVLVIGGVLIVAARRGRVTPEIVLLAVGAALGLAGIDIVYTSRHIISPIYLLDAAAELGVVVLWAIAWRRTKAADRAW